MRKNKIRVRGESNKEMYMQPNNDKNGKPLYVESYIYNSVAYF